MRAPIVLTALARLLARSPRLARALGDLESSALRDLIDETALLGPIYIAGLARAGSTVLLQVLADHEEVGTHRYRDYPFLCTPWWWDLACRLTPRLPRRPRERAHGDRLKVTPESPEAMEEMVWMMFFPHLHDPARSQVMDASVDAPDFERFYRDHARKLLLARKRRRYVAKGNYNVTRLAYLHRLFPDARFVLPVREPIAHVISLMRQHERFCAAGRRSARVPRHMRTSGHTEFGLARQPIHAGDGALTEAISQAYAAGEEARGFALQWHAIYRQAADALAADPGLCAATLIVPYERLCQEPAATLAAILAHAGLKDERGLIDRWAPRIAAPAYYEARLPDRERALVRDLTAETAARFGY